MDVTNLKHIASESELNKRGRVLARIGEVNVFAYLGFRSTRNGKSTPMGKKYWSVYLGS
jgi:hypothetical protein